MNEKFENLLNLALETPERVREQTADLNVGFDGRRRTWEWIVKYNGSLDDLRAMGIGVEELIAGYGILTVPEQLAEAVGNCPQIEYVEMPKRYYYSQVIPGREFCIAQVADAHPYLTGEGVLLAVLDSGIEYALPVFLTPEGETRIAYLWDQSLTGEAVGEQAHLQPPQGFLTGIEFRREQIQAALDASSAQERFLRLPSMDTTGHGTAVAGIAGGSRLEGYAGVAPQAEFLIVKLGAADPEGFPRTTQIMRGVTYAVRKALELQKPLVINLSFGNNYGAHDGSSLLERFLDNAAEIGRTVICVGTGNEGNAGRHFVGSADGVSTALLAVGSYERSLNVQIWKQYTDSYRLTVRSPGGRELVLTPDIGRGKYSFLAEHTRVLVYYGEPLPYTVSQEINLEFLPEGGKYVDSGVWTFLFQAHKTPVGGLGMYLPSGAALNEDTRFFESSAEGTFTVPSTAQRVISVGAYDSAYDAYADFSGRGYGISAQAPAPNGGREKPDLAAPGVNVLAPDRYGAFAPFTGTSFATPIAAGSCALLMEWGIVIGNDPFLYGEKLKAYLRAGAMPLRGEQVYPNPRSGYGKLCVRRSL